MALGTDVSPLGLSTPWPRYIIEYYRENPENDQKKSFFAFLTKIIASHKKTCKKKLVENFERNFLKKSVFRQIAYFLSYDVKMASF